LAFIGRRALREHLATATRLLIARRFFQSPSNLWASPKYMRGFGKPTHPRDLTNAAFVTHPEHKGPVMLTNGRSDFEVRSSGRIHADDLETIKALIELGEGIAWLPDFLTADGVKAGNLVQVLPQWRPKQQQLGTCYFLYAGRQYALPKVESFIQTALSVTQPNNVARPQPIMERTRFGQFK
jgi:DNA-binding transcriptional LysR family regulator